MKKETSLLNIKFLDFYTPKFKKELEAQIKHLNKMLEEHLEVTSKDARRLETLLNKIGARFFLKFAKGLNLPRHHDVSFHDSKTKSIKHEKGFHGDHTYLLTKPTASESDLFMEASLERILDNYFLIDRLEPIIEELESYLIGEMFVSIWHMVVKPQEIPKHLKDAAKEALLAAKAFRPAIAFLGSLKEEGEKTKQKKYEPPVSDHKSYAVVKELLLSICQELREELEKMREEYYLELAHGFMKKAGNKESIVRYTNSLFSMQLRAPLEAMIEEKYEGYNKKPNHRLKKDFKATALKMAKRDVLEMQNLFVTRNLKKLTSILEAKNNMLKASKDYVICDLGSFEGMISISFKDGSSFKVKHKIVDKCSSLGTRFYQFPTTFHEVILPNGSKLTGVSEQAMNKKFII